MTTNVSLTLTGTERELASILAFIVARSATDPVPVVAMNVGTETIDEGAAVGLADEVDVEAAKKAAAAEKRKASDRKRKAAAKAKADAEAAEVDPLGLADDEVVAEAAVTLDDLKEAVAEAIERAGLDKVKAVFKAAKVAKLSDIKPAQYKAVCVAVVDL